MCVCVCHYPGIKVKGRLDRGPKHGLSGMERLVDAFWDFSVKHNLGDITQEQTYEEACVVAKMTKSKKWKKAAKRAKRENPKKKSRKSKSQERPTTSWVIGTHTSALKVGL